MSTMVAAINSPSVRYTHLSGPGRNAVGGNTDARAAARRSTARNATINATAAQSSAMVNGRSEGIPATLTINAAAPSSSSDHTGTRITVAPPAPERPGRASGTSTVIAIVRMTSAPKAHRHEENWAKSPPAAGPSRVPTPHMADTNAEALVHSARGSAALITAYPRPASSPPAAPWTVRPTSSSSMVGATAHSTLPAPNTVNAPRYADRGPNRATAAPTVVAAATEATR